MGRISSTSRGGRLKSNIDLNTLEGLAKFAEKKGFQDEVEDIVARPKISLFQRIGRAITAFETGNALYQSRYEGKSFASTYTKDVLSGLQEGVTGRNVSLTPKKKYKDILLKEGFTDRPGKLDAVDVFGLIGDIVGDPATFFGGVIGKGILKGVQKIAQGAKKLPLVGGVVSGIDEGLKGLFRPFHKIEKLGDVGKNYRSAFEKYAKGTRAQINDFLDEISSRAATTKGIPKAGQKIGEAVETGTRTGDKFLDDIMDSLVATQKKFTRDEVARGILRHELPDYMHHMITPEAGDFLQKGGDLSQFVKPIRVKLGAAKGRKYEGVVKEINQAFKEKTGFNLFEEDAFKAFAKRGIDSIRSVQTYDFLTRIGTQFGRKAPKDFIDEFGVRWVETGAKELAGVRVPKPIADHIDEFKRIFTNDEATNSFLRIYDKALNFWKGTVTGYFPAFHTRNFLGGTFNNWIAGINTPAPYLTARDILTGKKGELVTKTGQKLSYDTIRQALKDYGVTGQTGILDVQDFLKKGVGEDMAFKLSSLPQKVMGATENYIRTPLFIDSLQKGMSFEDAARKVIKFHFDYMPEGFTAFEKNVMKRIIPFYTWTRHNIPLQLEQLLMNPGKYSGVFKTQRAFGIQPSGEEEELLPRWLRERFTIKAEGGYWSGIGLPIEEATEKLSNPLRGFGISLSPFIKVPIEQLTGYNLFKEKQIDQDVYAKQYKNAPKPLQEWLELKEFKGKNGKVYYKVNPRKRYWLEVIASRGLSTALRLADYTDDKKNLLSFITTIRKYTYDPKDLKKWTDEQKQAELEQLLIETSEVAEFKRLFVPKGRIR